MSSKCIITVEDYQFLDAYQQTSAIAVRDAFGRIIGYSVYDVTANIAYRRKKEFQDKMNAKIKKIEETMNSLDYEMQHANHSLNGQIQFTLEQYKEKMDGYQKIDSENMMEMFMDAKKKVSQIISQVRTDMLSQYQNKMNHLLIDLNNDIQKTLNDAQTDLNSIKNDLALKKEKENKYAIAFLENAKQSLNELKGIYDEHYNNYDIIKNLENDMKKCEVNLENSLYETVMANAITIQEQCYEEILLFDKQRQEYNSLMHEALYHVEYLLKYSEERMKLKDNVLTVVNEMSENKKLSKRMLQKDLRLFSPNQEIDHYLNILNAYKAKLTNQEYQLQDIKDELEMIRGLYEKIDQAFHDAVALYGNYLEREAFLNNIIDKFEDHGRVYKGSRIGENDNNKDFTQPIFALFEDETTGSEFIVEINYKGNPQKKLESEFHVHRIKGDVNNQFENEQTEKLVHQAISDENEDAIHGGIGCERSTIGKLSDDQRILKVQDLIKKRA